MKFHHIVCIFLALPFFLIAYLFLFIVWQLTGEEKQTFLTFLKELGD